MHRPRRERRSRAAAAAAPGPPARQAGLNTRTSKSQHAIPRGVSCACVSCATVALP